MTIPQYIERLNASYKLGNATEHTYRGYLQSLLETIAVGATVTNEPARIKCGAPDYIITRKEIPVGYIEAKDIGKDIRHKDYKEQFERYRKSLNNLIITDYLEFELYIDGEFKTKIKIAEIDGHHLKPLPQNFDEFTAFVKSFSTHIGQTIKSSQKLAVMMADKAKLLSQVIERALSSDEENDEDSSLKEQMYAFKDILIHDIKPRDFADIYAQTIAYGMFAARLHDTTLNDFSRQEAAELIPKTNPFLRKLFQYIAGYDLDTRIVWIVDALADIFRATDVAALLNNFGRATQTHDPIIHFYETFLAEYDPVLRKARGVWYTPEPVVNFIVRAVDDILKTDFNLPQGLADNSKIKIKRKAVTKATADQRSKLKEVETEVEVHKVQILDPATGTGTFLAEAIKHIYKRFAGQQGIWSNYVENHLVPRLNGFELLMASYAMAHLKLDLLLAETGYRSTKDQRFRIYLTNSLEEHHADTGTLFANWLSSEANEANHIKRDTPVMVVMGNPPYSVSSTNKSEWIEKLTADYKKNLNERNMQPLSDDYIKFIRFGQHFIDKNGEGILAYISNNSFIDGLVHRQMRKHLLESFDKIYVLDLHGSTKRKEISSDGSKDENVFDIQPGVSINIFVKLSKSAQIGQVYKFDIQGSRELKYNFLKSNSVNSILWEEIRFKQSEREFMFKNFSDVSSLEDNSFKVCDLFRVYASGITTERDVLTIQFDKEILSQIIKDFKELDRLNIVSKYSLEKDGRDWTLDTAIKDVKTNSPVVSPILYRPFDIRNTLYTGKTKGFHSYPRYNVMAHMLEDNLALIIGRQGQAIGGSDWNIISISNTIVDCNMFYRGRSTVFPLYVYTNQTNQISLNTFSNRTPNLNEVIVKKIGTALNLKYSDEREQNCNSFSPLDILDYIYGILHHLKYRDKYKEVLKIDFPLIPYPTDAVRFWELVKLGGELRQLHLLESSAVDNYITTYPQNGDNMVNAIRYVDEKVYINNDQYFDGVPAGTWQFYIGGYQPAQKWLKDRKGRGLSFDDILHYQRMIVALTETQRVMAEIDKIDFE